MKALKYLILFTATITTLVLGSCENEERQYAIDWIDSYIFDVPDTLLTASAHEFVLTLHAVPDYLTIVGEPTSWKGFEMDTNIWDNSLPGKDKWYLNKPTEETGNPNIVSYGWVQLEKVIENTSALQMQVKVKSNDTGEYRAVRVYVGHWERYTFYEGEVIIAQNPVPSDEAFR